MDSTRKEIIKTEIPDTYEDGSIRIAIADSRDYLGDSDDDYGLKHFFIKFNKTNNRAEIWAVFETLEEIFPENEHSCDFPCSDQETFEKLKKIAAEYYQ